MKNIFQSFLFGGLIISISAFTILQTGNGWTAPAKADKLTNPFAGEKAGAKGENLFSTNCERCHGITGVGDGVDGSKLKPKPADLTSQAVLKQSDGALFWKISTGLGEMPAFKKELNENDRWKLVNYIRELGTKGTAGK